jgi:hypothetical protein
MQGNRHARAPEGCCENAFFAQSREDLACHALKAVEAKPIVSFGKRSEFRVQNAQEDFLRKLRECLARDFHAA